MRIVDHLPQDIGTSALGLDTPRVGDCVVIRRDENKYPSKGTWPAFRGRRATVVEVNPDDRPHLIEYRVSFGPTRRRPDGSLHGDDVVTWFKVYELIPALAAVAPVDERRHFSLGDRTLVG
ncbi:hypothetical protein MARA_11130 [Mycolicibacterium arabiense]|uniref:Nitrile hydratase subunit beta n=1 Tax=Mycolicibacterium arabiense TaxID=1286181 RepID=A0A7I7RV30_9MYCO|nr:hypothetical protein [Mycolicibacterium arabiense]MCV7375698.1 hypothetical protein [Mycolicibacterium arabiense]BBY47645.1 hypothetical protein MARA_11130 [Mycolicibacterium arabiense]